jgi:hypothetical protein
MNKTGMILVGGSNRSWGTRYPPEEETPSGQAQSFSAARRRWNAAGAIPQRDVDLWAEAPTLPAAVGQRGAGGAPLILVPTASAARQREFRRDRHRAAVRKEDWKTCPPTQLRD